MKIKHYFTLFILVVFSVQVEAQIDSTINLNLLRAPASPASNLLGMSPTDVQKVSDPTALAVSLQKGTQNFSQLPTNFAVDIAPGWVISGKKFKVEDMEQTRVSFWRSLVVSFAVNGNKSSDQKTDSTQLAAGFKFSILRGHLTEKYRKNLRLLTDQLKVMSGEDSSFFIYLDSNSTKYPTYDSLRNANKELVKNHQQDSQEYLANQNLMNEIREKAKEDYLATFQYNRTKIELDYKRYGFKWDVAAGQVWNFPDNRFASGKSFRTGLWTTISYEKENGLDASAMARYLYNPESVFAFADDAGILYKNDLSTLDFGGQISYSNIQNRFSGNLEYIYRSVLGNTEKPNPSWRLVLNLNYELKKNAVLSFSFGRNFDKVIYKDGNLVAALNLIWGFGSERRLL